MNKKKLKSSLKFIVKTVGVTLLFCLGGGIFMRGIDAVFPNLGEGTSGLIAGVIMIALVFLINNYRQKIAELRNLIEYLDDKFDVYNTIDTWLNAEGPEGRRLYDSDYLKDFAIKAILYPKKERDKNEKLCYKEGKVSKKV